MVYTKEEFKQLWEANDVGSGITYYDIAQCAEAWGLFSKPRCTNIDVVIYQVLRAAGCRDAEEYNPDYDRFLTQEQRDMMKTYIDKINALGEEIKELKAEIMEFIKAK